MITYERMQGIADNPDSASRAEIRDLAQQLMKATIQILNLEDYVTNARAERDGWERGWRRAMDANEQLREERDRLTNREETSNE